MKMFLYAFTDGSFRVVTGDARPDGLTEGDKELIQDEALRVIDITDPSRAALVEVDGSTSAIETIEDPDEPLPVEDTSGDPDDDDDDLDDESAGPDDDDADDDDDEL